LQLDGDRISITIADDGRGSSEEARAQAAARGSFGLTSMRARLTSLAFGFEPRLPHRAGLPDPAPLPHQRPGVEQRFDHSDSVEPFLVAGGDSLFEVENRPVHDPLRKEIK